MKNEFRWGEAGTTSTAPRKQHLTPEDRVTVKRFKKLIPVLKSRSRRPSGTQMRATILGEGLILDTIDYQMP